MTTVNGSPLTEVREAADSEGLSTETAAFPDDQTTSQETPAVPSKNKGRTGKTTEESDSGGRRFRWARTGWTSLAIRCVTGLLLVALVGGAAWEGWLLMAQHRRDVAAEQALDTAQRFASAFTNADPDSIDHQIDEITEMATGDFQDKYLKSVSQIRAMLIDKKVSTHGDVVGSAVRSISADNAEVLLFVKQTFSSPDLPELADANDQPAEVVGMAVAMAKVGGKWLVSKVVPGSDL